MGGAPGGVGCTVGAPWRRGPLEMSDRTWTSQGTVGSWRAPKAASTLERPKFFLIEDGGCNFTSTRDTFRKLLDGRPMQEVLPISVSQYVPDTHLIDTFTTHPHRVRDPTMAEWHVVAASPVTSELIAKLGLLGGQEGHAHRLKGLARCLRNSRRLTQKQVRPPAPPPRPPTRPPPRPLSAAARLPTTSPTPPPRVHWHGNADDLVAPSFFPPFPLPSSKQE